MCGRFNIVNTPGLAELLDGLGVVLKLPEPRYNVAPTESVPLLQGGELQQARWWLTPSWSDGPSQRYAMFNARCETLSRSRAFRGPFRRQRGVVPMSSFIEWRRDGDSKQPWRISSERSALLVAALWDRWHAPEGGVLLSCTLVTTAAAAQFEPWHRRMPVMLTLDEARRWLDNSRPLASDDPLFAARCKFALQLEPVAGEVGNARNKRAQDQALCGEPVLLPPDTP